MCSSPDFNDIKAAAVRLTGHAVRTPLVESPELNRLLGGRLLIKAEMLQRTGSFKFRGAYNRISQLTPAQRRNGIVAYSSGNHAQAVAWTAQLLNIKATILMPSDAPKLKIKNTIAYGAEVSFYDRWRENREVIGSRLAHERGAILVPPFDDPWIIAGQGTTGLEMVEQAMAMKTNLDAVLTPAGGGSLIAGIALAVKALSPETQLHSVEPQGFDDLARSLRAGERVTNTDKARSFCDALMVSTPGALTFPIHRRLLNEGLAVSDAEVGQAMATAFTRLK
ncbi:MAG: threonine/serine dehydratase, partial [Rhodospirillales bacterium]|nr:threonine/serine dehydratase [Rhodospirillales bacterium]